MANVLEVNGTAYKIIESSGEIVESGDYYGRASVDLPKTNLSRVYDAELVEVIIKDLAKRNSNLQELVYDLVAKNKDLVRQVYRLKRGEN